MSLESETLNGWIHLRVKDDGKGFVYEERDLSRSGCGLFHVRDRLRCLGGTLRIESAPGQGTCVDVWAPLAAREPVLKAEQKLARVQAT